MMNALSEHVQYRISALCYSGVHSSGQGPQAAARLGNAYRRSRLTMNQAQLIDDFKFPDCTDKMAL